MPSIQDLRRSRQSQFEPKWRHFHPQARVWVYNPFDHDIVFYVADEANEQWQYRMPAGRTSELPGGAVATLGVKEIVDKLIGESPTDATHIWVLKVRAKYEAQIIKKIKDPPQKAARNAAGEINLAVSDEELAEEEDDLLQTQHSAAAAGAEDAPDTPRPGAKPPKPDVDTATPGARRGERRGLDKVKAIAEASTPGKESQVVEPD